MSLTESTMLPLGQKLPEFSLKDSLGNTQSSSDFSKANILVVIFMCNHCPYVIHIAPALAALAKSYDPGDVQFVGINSNDTEAYPADDFELMEPEREKWGYSFPYLFDATQDVAKAFDAACTPDIYVFDAERKLAYRGQFDDTRPNRISSGNYDSSENMANGSTLQTAINTLLEGNGLSGTQYPSIGCNIKWRS